jgi:hypothetical protein
MLNNSFFAQMALRDDNKNSFYINLSEIQMGHIQPYVYMSNLVFLNTQIKILKGNQLYIYIVFIVPFKYDTYFSLNLFFAQNEC